MYIVEALRKAVQSKPQGLATVYGDRQQTWAEFGERVQRLAGWLQASGLQADDRVAILSRNSDRYLECQNAIAWAGGIFSPLNARLHINELIKLINNLEAKVIFVDDHFYSEILSVKADINSLSYIVAMERVADADALQMDELIAQSNPAPFVERELDDTAAIYYTGGTTGLPKGVMLSNRVLATFSSNLALELEYRSDSVYIHVAPMFHLANHGVFVVTQQCGTHIFIDQVEPLEVLRLIERYRITHCMVVPTIIQMLTQAAQENPDMDVTSLQLLGYAGSPMPVELAKEAQRIFPKVGFVTGYGMTESPNITTLSRGDTDLTVPNNNRAKSVGRPYPAVSVRIVNDVGEVRAVGERGEIVVRSTTAMKGYWKNPEATAEIFAGGWLHTGDIGYFDEDGFLYICDRLKDMIISGGENIYSNEVEQVIYRHEAIAQCAVIAVPSERWGEAVHAVVVLKPGAVLEESELIAFCRANLAAYKCPKSVSFSADPLPLTGANKIDKRALREPYWQNMASSVN
ncbi:long-chain fatty acid--CoA ligase [Halioxenophilus sp. WMMB6]|uniref:acyl-CoA synthetase n=1 Tax=Halioxenophilus sp. WMMB6 TaxID=3073815 RepID=UPI00295E7787|nr:long-chain fatty acid--CoA ligase [Halioxenophilus sp. WMMB6]